MGRWAGSKNIHNRDFYSDVWIKTKDTHTNDFGKQNGHTGINSSAHKAGQCAHQQVRPFRLVQSQNFSERHFCNFFLFLQEIFFLIIQLLIYKSQVWLTLNSIKAVKTGACTFLSFLDFLLFFFEEDFFLEDRLVLPRLKLFLRVPLSILISSPPSGVSVSEDSSPVSPSEASWISSSLASISSFGLPEVC